MEYKDKTVGNPIGYEQDYWKESQLGSSFKDEMKRIRDGDTSDPMGYAAGNLSKQDANAILGNTQFVKDIYDFYYERDQKKFSNPEEAIDYFFNDRTAKNVNTLHIGKEVADATMSNSDAQNAAINAGLPNAFTANFTRTGDTSGRWGFTTPDGNFPDASYALQTTNMSIQNPSTPIYTFNVNGGGSAPGQYTSTAFQGETAGISMSVNQNTIGYLIGGNANAQSPGNTVNTFGGQSNSASQGVSINRTLNGNVQSSAQMQAPGSPTTARAPEGGIVAPPWGQNPVSNMQGFAYALYTSNQYVDNRVSACIQFHYNHPGGSGTNNSGINFHRGQFPVPNQFFQGWAGSGSGNYCLCLRSNHIFNTVFGYPNPSPSWGWTASDIRLKNNITYL